MPYVLYTVHWAPTLVIKSMSKLMTHHYTDCSVQEEAGGRSRGKWTPCIQTASIYDYCHVTFRWLCANQETAILLGDWSGEVELGDCHKTVMWQSGDCCVTVTSCDWHVTLGDCNVTSGDCNVTSGDCNVTSSDCHSHNTLSRDSLWPLCIEERRVQNPLQEDWCVCVCISTGRDREKGEGERERRRREVGESCTVTQAHTVQHLAASGQMCTNYLCIMYVRTYAWSTFCTQYEPYPLAVYCTTVYYTKSHIICMLCNMNKHENL